MVDHDLPSTFDPMDEEDDDDDAITMTPKEVVDRLHTLWKSESNSPDILFYEYDIIEHVISFAEHQMGETDENPTDLLGGIVKMEAYRLEYALGRYLGCRAKKIEKYFDFFLERDDKLMGEGKPTLMSPKERELAVTLQQISQKHFTSILEKMPKSVQNMQFLKEGPKPNLDSYVFVKVDAEECESNTISDYGDNSVDIIEFKRGDQHLLPFSAVQENLKNGQVHLI